MFSPVFQSLSCENCSTKKEIKFDRLVDKHEYVEGQNISHSAEYDDWKNNNRIFKCKNCGATIMLNGTEISKTCPYCESPYVSQTEEIPGIKPDIVVPFQFDKTKAAEHFISGIKNMWFLPNQFKKSPPMDEIHGIYFPAFTFDAHTLSKYDGKLEKHTTHRGADGRTYTTVSYQHISGTKELNHKNVMVETSTHLSAMQFEGIKPFSSNGFVRYEDDFIRGYAVEHYVDALENCKKMADSMMDNIIRKSILSGYHYDAVNYLNVSTLRSDEKFSYIILPSYRFNYKYKGKDYTTFMNGQTGKVGKGLPRSAVKITFFVLGIIAVIAVIALIASKFS